MSAKPSFLRRERQEAIKKRQRRQAHRQRLALGRALHQVRRYRNEYWERLGFNRHRRPPRWLPAPQLRVPRIVRKHAALLRRAFGVLGS